MGGCKPAVAKRVVKRPVRIIAGQLEIRRATIFRAFARHYDPSEAVDDYGRCDRISNVNTVAVDVCGQRSAVAERSVERAVGVAANQSEGGGAQVCRPYVYRP